MGRSTDTKFRKLKKAEVNLLHEIWQIEYLNREQATRDLLSSRLGVNKSNLATTLNRLWAVSKTGYVLSEDDGEGGVYYILAADEIPTFTETARILELIFEYPKSQRNQSRVPYEAFVAKASKSTGLRTKEIGNVIRTGEQLGYLELLELSGHWILERSRLRYEKDYIKALARHFVKGNASRVPRKRL